MLVAANRFEKQEFEKKKADPDTKDGEYQGNPLFDNAEGYLNL